MSMLKRPFLMKVHTIIAAFILPAAIMFFVTGALYTWEIKGSYSTSTYEIALQKPIEKELAELVTLATNELKKRDLALPSGHAKIKTIGNAFKLEWTGSNRDIALETTHQPFIAQLKIKDTSWYRQFVQLHKAKGGTAFKVYAAAFSIALLLLLITGFIMAWQTPKLRNLTLISTLSGIVLFLLMMLSS